MARQRLTYKTYPVSTRVDPRGVFYALIQGATTEPESSLREIMAYKKITAFDPKQVVSLVEDIIQGGMELTALDGRPRAISSMIKTFLGFDGSFPTEDARVTSQTLVSRVRLLKDLRVPVNMDNFTLVNEREAQLPFDLTSATDWRLTDLTGNYIGIPAELAADSSTYFVSYLRLTGRRLDEPSSYRLHLVLPEAVRPAGYMDFVVTDTQGGAPAPYNPATAKTKLYRGFYSACLQVIWLDSSEALDPANILQYATSIVLQALNSDGGVIYETPMQTRIIS